MTLSTQGSDGFVASTAAWIATGRKTTKLAGWDLHPLKNHTFSRRTPRREGFAQRSAAVLAGPALRSERSAGATQTTAPVSALTARLNSQCFFLLVNELRMMQEMVDRSRKNRLERDQALVAVNANPAGGFDRQ